MLRVQQLKIEPSHIAIFQTSTTKFNVITIYKIHSAFWAMLTLRFLKHFMISCNCHRLLPRQEGGYTKTEQVDADGKVETGKNKF